MGIKLLVNGIAGAGKTDLLRTLDKTAFVVSRDAKSFALPLPHMLVDTFYNMTTLCYGSEIMTAEGKVHVPGIMDKIEAYHTKFGEYPSTVVIDSVSQIFMDVIDKASQKPNVFGSQGAEVTKEMAILTSFIHETLELSGINVVLLNHIIEEKADGKATGSYEAFGSGKFLAKGGFYSTTNEAITIIPKNGERIVYTRDTGKMARTMLTDIPEMMYVANSVDPSKSRKLKEHETYFTLKSHIERLLAEQTSVEEWSI